MFFLELIAQSLVQGSIYALIALGLTLVYGLLRILHVLRCRAKLGVPREIVSLDYLHSCASGRSFSFEFAFGCVCLRTQLPDVVIQVLARLV